MRTEQSFTVAIAGLSLIFVVLSALVGIVVRLTQKWTRTDEKLDTLIKVVREDKKATDRRVRWIEEYLWRQKR